MEALRPPTPKKYSPYVEGQHARYESKVQFAIDNEELLLRAIHAAFSFEGTPFDGNVAAKIVGREAARDGSSFHEALYGLHYLVTHPGEGFHW